MQERFTGPYHNWSKVPLEQANLTKRFSKSKHLEELHKYQKGDKKGQYVDFQSEEFWRIMSRVEVAVSSVCATFDEYTRQFSKQSHLPYTPMPLMMDIVRATMVIVASISSLTTAVAGT
ncbi:hypothetical protein M9H77_06674 [Catharanthus roseus]|uniref:Uncharacterized protein n=1 Tax=Catharanthus roseus TaxID=4058 RepID=A0ACC0BSS4_CATRO|nr:hypothetical protein M9H77_06674 [Catharanthus roseus]